MFTWHISMTLCVCLIQTPTQTLTVAVARSGIQTFQTEKSKQISVSQNFLLPIQRREHITRLYYWQWRGGLASLGGQVDFSQSLYHTHSEGILNIFHNNSANFMSAAFLLLWAANIMDVHSLLLGLCQKLKQVLPVHSVFELLKIKALSEYMWGFLNFTCS